MGFILQFSTNFYVHLFNINENAVLSIKIILLYSHYSEILQKHLFSLLFNCKQTEYKYCFKSPLALCVQWTMTGIYGTDIFTFDIGELWELLQVILHMSCSIIIVQ